MKATVLGTVLHVSGPADTGEGSAREWAALGSGGGLGTRGGGTSCKAGRLGARASATLRVPHGEARRTRPFWSGAFPAASSCRMRVASAGSPKDRWDRKKAGVCARRLTTGARTRPDSSAAREGERLATKECTVCSRGAEGLKGSPWMKRPAGSTTVGANVRGARTCVRTRALSREGSRA